jgi:hypothetical protein
LAACAASKSRESSLHSLRTDTYIRNTQAAFSAPSAGAAACRRWK